MIEFIQGNVYSLEENAVILLTGNWGIKVITHKRTIQNLTINQKIVLFTYLYASENKIALYGFLTKEEKEIFEQLIGISNVGPSKAMSILEVFPPKELINVIKNEDAKRLSMAKGISQETAISIIARLSKSLVQKPKIEYSSIKKDNKILSEAIGALKELGLPASKAKEIVVNAIRQKNFSSTEELIQYILSSENITP